MGDSGTLKKLEIKGYEDPDGKTATGNTFTLQINPASISHNFGHEYQKEDGVDVPLPLMKFKSTSSQDISFDFYLDATGIVPDVTGKPSDTDIDAEIEKFKETTYYYNSNTHEPPYCQIKLNDADLIKYKKTSFVGRLVTMKIAYTLFTPNGKPIRAKVSVAFKSTCSKSTATKVAGKSSPDLTHLITIKAGDSLPMLCKKIYGKAHYYPQIAKINKLVNFRYLKPGTELTFPPMK